MAPRDGEGPRTATEANTREIDQGQLSTGDTVGTGDTPGRDLTDDHLEFLAAHAIKPEVAREHVRSVVEPEDLPEDRDGTWPRYVPTVLYRWRMGDRGEWQIRIPEDKRTDDGPKYLFRKGSGDEIPLNQVRDDGAGPILLVEGTNQHLAAASYAPDEYAIYGMFGCWGWSKTDLSFAARRLVYVVIDADLASNRDVWNAAQALRDALKTIKAAAVQFVALPGIADKQGLDDFLATIEGDDQRRQALATLLDDASPDLPKAPSSRKKKARSPYFNEHGGIKPKAVAETIHATFPMALTAEDQVAIYRNGVYRTNRMALVTALVQLLGDDYRRGFLATVEDVIVGILDARDWRLPDHIDRPWLNVLNGMVDLETGERHDHDPDLFSAVQFPIHYDPDATCPTFDQWAKEIIGDQLQDLLETASTMLDPTTIPTKALLLYGPARSGKSTFLRLLKAIAGTENTSGVNLHELTEDQFARANLYGRVLNVAADLSARHVQDLTWFKLMTGEDLVRGNRKYGRDFHFVNQALFAFSANELPTVGESSRAYVERIKPFKFGNSFAGRIDTTIEPRMREELPGILNRLIDAYRKRKERGRDLVTNPAIQREFEQASDRVQMWMAEEMTIIVKVGDQPVIPGQTCIGTSATCLQSWPTCSTTGPRTTTAGGWAGTRSCSGSRPCPGS
jgi:putative DNA primase/helicase